MNTAGERYLFPSTYVLYDLFQNLKGMMGHIMSNKIISAEIIILLNFTKEHWINLLWL
jgi:hypothetical protein